MNMNKIILSIILSFAISVASASETLDTIKVNSEYFTEYPIQFKLDVLVNDLANNSYKKDRKEREALFSLLSKEELRTLRNTIFAKHGHIFDNEHLTSYYRKFDWYSPSDKLYQINDNDKNIISSIKKFEASNSIDKSNILKKFSIQSLPSYLNDKTSIRTTLLTRADMRKLLNIDRDVITQDNFAILKVNITKKHIGLAIESLTRGVDCGSRSFFILNKKLDVISSINLGGFCGDIASGEYSHVVIEHGLIHVITVGYDSERKFESEFVTKLKSYFIKEDGSTLIASNQLTSQNTRTQKTTAGARDTKSQIF